MDRINQAPSAYTGTRASYVALASITILSLALISSIWTSEVSGSVALLGIMAVYLASQELLVLFMMFCPASILIDIIRLSGVPHGTHGRGWLILLQLLEMAAKIAGGVFAWSLHRSVASGEGLSYAAPMGPPPGGSAYQRVEDPFSTTAYAPPRHDSTPASLSSSSLHPHPHPQHQHQQQPLSPGAPAAPHHDLV